MISYIHLAMVKDAARRSGRREKPSASSITDGKLID
jgi:hypothetical protein